MVRHGWITQDQFSSLFPTSRKTLLLGVADDENPPDTDCDWSLTISDEEMAPEPETVEAAPALSSAASAPPLVAGGNEARRWPRVGWASRGLLMCILLFASFFAGLQFFRANSAVLAVARQESKQAKADEPAKADDVPPAPPIVPIDDLAPLDNLPKSPGPSAPPPAPAKVARPKSKASLYDRVRQIVRDNKTEETDRLGIGDIAYQDVPEDGSIMVGMEVTYAPFFSHYIIKSVQPIYQRPDGTRYSGPVCGTPTGVSDRVTAKSGYAIGGAAIRAGMGIDGLQLTFMEIGPDGLNPSKSYLSKWLGINAGSSARTYVNDGRPIIGIVGMSAKNASSPAFCMGLVTTKPGALAAPERPLQTQQQFMQGR
jgi:hypothetical protein